MLTASGEKYTFFLCSKAQGFWAAHPCPVRRLTPHILPSKPQASWGSRALNSRDSKAAGAPKRGFSELSGLLHQTMVSTESQPPLRWNAMSQCVIYKKLQNKRTFL